MPGDGQVTVTRMSPALSSSWQAVPYGHRGALAARRLAQNQIAGPLLVVQDATAIGQLMPGAGIAADLPLQVARVDVDMREAGSFGGSQAGAQTSPELSCVDHGA